MPEFLTTEKIKEVVSNAPPELKGQVFQALVDKGYEIEGFNANFSPFEALKNIPESTKEFGKAIYSAIMNPLQSIKAISGLAQGGIRKGYEAISGKQAPVGLISGTEQDEKTFDNMVEFFIARYGSKDRLLNTIEKDPVGFLADASAAIGGAGAAVKGVGVAGKIGMVSKAGGTLVKYSRLLEPTTAAIKTARTINELSGINKLIRNSSSRFMAKATGLSGAVRKNIAQAANLAEDPTIWMSKHGIHGSLENMHTQLGNIETKTVKIVDDLLASVEDTYKTESANRFLTELRNAYGKVVDDIVTGSDVKTSFIVDAKGNPVKIAEEIPYKQREPVFVPMANMSKKMEENLAEIQALLKKNKTEGLTLTELNRTKRIGDRILNIYDRAGDVKAGVTAEKLGDLRSEIRGFIENTAKEKGIPDIQELNRQTQTSMLLKENIGDLLITTETRSAIGDQLIFLMGLTGTVATGGGAPLIGAATVVGGREIIRIPRVRSFIGNRLRLIADSEYETLLRGVQTGNKSKRFGEILRRERRLLQKAFPELRLTGISQEKIPVREEE